MGKSQEEIDVVPGSMAVTAAALDGSSPEVMLGIPPGVAVDETTSLFARRQQVGLHVWWQQCHECRQC
eukprot:90139-Rhodomonas_salina.2